ncbi:hypothetical protein LJC35_05780 [Parabacteroides sp. OttesenSCG-928-N08]|nr:hypothetical protein [Parabacteroides sp. OttesenSCG-928-N08]
MKKSIIIFLLFPMMIQAQEQVKRYLIDEFTTAVATTKGLPIRASFNYDCVKQEMQFEEDGEVFRLDNINNIDTLILDGHKMIPFANRFVEVVHTTDQYQLLLDHKIKINNKGKKGAMGTTTQGTVENIDISLYKLSHTDKRMKSNSVYEGKNESGYILMVKGKAKKFKDAKSFAKAFPGQKERIEAYIKEHGISFKDEQSIITLIEFVVN